MKKLIAVVKVALLASASLWTILYTEMNTAGEIRPFQPVARSGTSGNQACSLLLLFTCCCCFMNWFKSFVLDFLYLLICPWTKIWQCRLLKFCPNVLVTVFLIFLKKGRHHYLNVLPRRCKPVCCCGCIDFRFVCPWTPFSKTVGHFISGQFLAGVNYSLQQILWQ